ncbi:regulatory protein VanR (plasmid) [Clostridium botulinum A2B7 92]|uniref:transcriptional regulator n=1 Tax=Clostridium botulinum TaxID=1491 RepID=UPI0007E0F8E6|nr:transcriptional regulator [Clostridium botulinum]KEI94045.1 regulatory protein VanR [Clostridium botulinum A2B7 92]
MNKKKIIAIIIACVVIVGGIAVGLNSSKATSVAKKPTQNPKPTQEEQLYKKEINKNPTIQKQTINKGALNIYKGAAKVDYTDERTVIYIGTEKLLDVSNKDLFVAETIISPSNGKSKITGSEEMNLNEKFLTGKTKYKSMYAFKQKATLGGIDNMYFFINYKAPFTVENKVKDKEHPATCLTTYAKVVSSDGNGIKLDNGQYYNLKKGDILLSFVNEDLNVAYDGTCFDLEKCFPKNTLVKIYKENNELKDIQKIAVLY